MPISATDAVPTEEYTQASATTAASTPKAGSGPSLRSPTARKTTPAYTTAAGTRWVLMPGPTPAWKPAASAHSARKPATTKSIAIQCPRRIRFVSGGRG
ncbi:MAG TPA: hypothetical protein VMG38_16465 [Trebonia sp.]|nr:hypothetical protein [Trebonia sp.]